MADELGKPSIPSGESNSSGATVLAPPSQSADRLIGKTVGRYSIKRIIASGGMGTVYEAVQEQPRRVVALKLMKHGIASRSAMRRFEYESQILARLRHPGIAQVYEAGQHDDGTGGVPYFAMEYIPNAKTITDYADAKKLGTRERLELFAKVCEAVHHGHQKGIIHRDLKPGNILVDSSGQPKIIDFGVARATDSDLAVTTLQTDIGQLIGTLQYMSPEQCEADPHDLDTRSDVYALGVVLYELLCGKLPYDVSRVAIHEAVRVIREESPPKPSSINRALRGDVETIMFKAMERERNRRYQSSAELGEDIARYLQSRPIRARPPSLSYQVRMLAHRYRKACAAFATVVLTLVVAIAAMINAGHRAQSALHETQAGIVSVERYLTGLEKYRTPSYLLRRLDRDEYPRHGGRTVAFLPQRGDSRQRLVFLDDQGTITRELLAERPIPQWVHDQTLPGGAGHISNVLLEDVLPGNPGRELIVTLQLQGHFCCMAIYDLDLNVLREMWNLGSLNALNWDAERRLLRIVAYSLALGSCVPEMSGYDSAGCPTMRSEPELIFAIRPENVQGVVAPLVGDALHPPAQVEWALGKHPLATHANTADWLETRGLAAPDPHLPNALTKILFSVDLAHGRSRMIWLWAHMGSDGQLLGDLRPELDQDLAVVSAIPKPLFVPIDLKNLAAGCALAESLMRATGSFNHAERLLLADGSIAPEVRTAAIGAARAMTSNWRWLGGQAERMIENPSASDAQLALALGLAEEGVRIHHERCTSPERCKAAWYALNTLLAVQYRTGKYEAVLQTFDECQFILTQCDLFVGHENWLDLAYVAMAHHRLGRAEEAAHFLKRALELFRAQPQQFPKRYDVVIAQAEDLISPDS